MSLPVELPDRPTLVLEVERLKALLAKEAVAREAFRDKIEPHEKGEFINGIVYMHSPSRHSHNRTRFLIERLLASAIDAGRIDGLVTSEKALCAFTRNDYEPDVVWFGQDKAAGITAETMLYPVPDFIVEVLSPSTSRRDRTVKFDDYAAHGVREYWIVDADARTVEQFVLDDVGEYQLVEKLEHAEIQPASFPGLSIPVVTLFDSPANFAFIKTF